LKILVTGAAGQLGRCLIEQGTMEDLDIDDYGRNMLDITNLDGVRSVVKNSNPDAVINAAAYTAVDKAESEPEQAFAVNEQGSKNLAIACSEADIPLIHVSTDYVFSGTASVAYREDDPVDPQGVYGVSKLAGERAVLEHCHKYIIVRAAWVYSEYGNNFVKTMLRLSESRNQLSVVDDQIGNPTYAGDIATALLEICKNLLTACNNKGGQWGIYHYAGATKASWYEFAKVIFEGAFDAGLIDKRLEVTPISTAEYPTHGYP